MSTPKEYSRASLKESMSNSRYESGGIIIDDYRSVSSFDSPISDSCSIENGYTSMGVDGTVAKTLIIQGTVLGSKSIAIETVIKLSKNDENCSPKTDCPIGKHNDTGSLNNIDDDCKDPEQTNDSEKSTLNIDSSSKERCAEQQMKEFKMLIDFIAKTIKSNRESNVPSHVARMHQKIDEFKKQMDSIKMGNEKCSLQDDGGNAAYFVESQPDRPCRNNINVTKIYNQLPRGLDTKADFVEMRTLHPHENPLFNLYLSNEREKRHFPKSTSVACNECNPLRNSNRCSPCAIIPYNGNLKRKPTTICFCYCAYRKGFDGVTYHTLCHCCGPSTNY